MNKAKFLKVILPSMLGLVGAPVLIASTVSAAVLTTTNNAKATRSNDQSTYYLYDNQYFNNLEEAAKYAIIKNQPISSDFYIGNAQNAVFDQETGRLDISKLRLGDRSRLYPAYKNALGQYTPSYQEAKKSFVNPGLIQYKYDDLNGRLFNSYEEAKESMENNRYATPVTYYDGLNINGNEVKLNPFNKDDINEFKWLALDSLINQPSNNSPLSWSIFTKINHNGTYTYTDQLNRLFDYKYSFLESVDYVLNKFLEMKYQFLNNLDYTVSLSLDGRGKAHNNYDFRNVRNDSNQKVIAKLINKNRIDFSNVSFEQLQSFNSFLHKDKMYADKTIDVKIFSDDRGGIVWNRDIAEYLNVHHFIGTNFNLNYTGDDWGEDWGTDIKILERGTEGSCWSELDFNVSTSIDEQTSHNRKLLEQYNDLSYKNFKTYLGSNIPSCINNDDPSYNPFADKYLGFIWDKITHISTIKTNLILDVNKTFKKDSNINSTLKINEGNINWYDSSFFGKIDKDKILIKNNIKNDIQDSSIKDTNNECNPTVNLLNIINIQSFFDKNKESLIPIINFNGYPLFKVNNSLGMDVSGYDNEELFSGSTDYQKNNYKNPVTNTDEVDDKDLINKEKTKNYLNDKTQYFNEITNNLINVSQSYLIDKTNKVKDSIKSFKTKLINNQEQLLGNDLYYDNNYNLKFKDESKNQNLEPASLLGEETKWSLNNVIASYNQCMSNIMKKYKQIPSYTLSKLVDPNNILFLRNSENNGTEGDVLEFNYGEILSRPDDINVSVMNNNNLKVFYDQDKLKNAIKNSALTDPAKVVVLYDLMGNIINPGVKLSSSEELLTTSDAIYDSESTIMDNILRTKVIKNDPSKTFYLEDDGRTYTLLDNQANLIYNLAIEGKTYYFITYQNAWWYYYDYVKLNSVKVVK